MKNKQNAVIEFEAKLEKLILSIRERAKSQFDYNLENNIPNKIGGITFENAAEHGISHGVVSAVSQMNDWDINKSLLFAHHILEDVNAHTEANELVQFIPEYQGKYWQEKQTEKKSALAEEMIKAIKSMPSDDDFNMCQLDVIKKLEEFCCNPVMEMQ